MEPEGMTRYSVVMPAYNAQASIGRALQSLFTQHLHVDEIIIVDDGSTDRTVDAAGAWQDRLPLVLLQNGLNRGIGASLRRGVDAAKGDWVLRLDADDRWLPSHVQALDATTREPGVCLVSSPAIMVDDAGQRIRVSKPVRDKDVRMRLMWDNPLIHSASGFERESYLAVGGYREDIRWEDYDLWIRLLAVGKLGFADSPGIEYTVSNTSLSRARRSVALHARWQCQLQAMVKFWRRHPLAAARSFVIGAARASYASKIERILCG
jgi:glycosyltransferase involved in cell wall biosynthesis